MPEVVLETKLPGIKFLKKGKVRDLYELKDALLMVATDRLSAFDVVFGQGIPNKGMVLTKISEYWFKQVEDIIPNHIISTKIDGYPELEQFRGQLEGRVMIVKKVQPVMAECIVRGYLAGSGWEEYKTHGSVCGITLPKGLLESSKLPEPIFTPTTKAEVGVHDENIDFAEVVKLVGAKTASGLREKSIAVYKKAAGIAGKKGIVIADTKFEFGVFDGELMLIDECMTPDSSRFWPMASYEPGKGQPSFDKQFVRDYLLSIKWNKQPPAPTLPDEIILKTSEKYLEALRRITA